MSTSGVLGIKDATYGRNVNGIIKLQSELNADIDRAVKAIDGSEYQNFVTTIGANWAGEDADRFISEFKKATTEIKSNFAKYKTTINNAINEDIRYFDSFQNTNADVVKSNIK